MSSMELFLMGLLKIYANNLLRKKKDCSIKTDLIFWVPEKEGNTKDRFTAFEPASSLFLRINDMSF